MLVRIGTNNPLKVEALREVLLQLGVSHVLESEDVPSGVSNQPIGHGEILKGAQNRAYKVLRSNSTAIGVESGVVCTHHQWFDVTYAYVTDAFGGRPSFGISCGFALPEEVGLYIEQHNRDADQDITLNQIYEELGLTSDPKLGNSKGAISIETGGHFTRKDQIKQALICALGKRFPVDSSRTS